MSTDKYMSKENSKSFWSRMKAYVDAHSSGGLTLDKVYPIGSVYISANGTNPNAIIGASIC